MATLTNYIRLVDGVSGPLKTMTNNASIATRSIGEVGSSLGTITNSTEIASRSIGEVGSSLGAITNSTGLATRSIGQVGYSLGAITNSSGIATRSVNRAGLALNGLGHYTNGLQAVTTAIRPISNSAGVATRSIGQIPPALELVGESAGRIDRATNAFRRMGETAMASLNMIPGMALGTMIGGKLSELMQTLSEIPGKLVGIAGGYAGIQARLNLLTGSQGKVAQMNEQIYQSALRSRGSFEGMAEAVTKIGMTAKEAFPDPSEVVPFMEGIQKLFVVGGTDKVSQGNAMLQLTQALGSGKLQGDEFRSIAEAAPLIEQMVAKYMGVTQGALKELSSKGAITSEVMKNAILSNLDEINRQFEAMPMTFDQHMQRLETIAYKSFTPVFNMINDFIASPVFTELMNSIGTGITIVAQAVAGAMTLLQTVFSGIANNVKWVWESIFGVGATLTDVLIPALVGVIGALGTFGAMWLAVNAQMIIHNALTVFTAICQNIAALATTIWTVATGGLAAALASCGGILGLFLILVGGIPIIISIAVGAFLAWMVATKGLENGIISAFESIGNAVDSAVTFMVARINDLIGLINSAIDAKNRLFGGNTGHVEKVSVQTNYGVQFRNKAVGMIGSVKDYWYDMKKGASVDTPSLVLPSASMGSEMPDLGKIGKNTGSTASNTGRMADSLDLLEEEIRDMKDYATQEQINKYTNARVTIEVGGISNNISSDVDVDGVIGKITEVLQDSMASSAEAVYSY